jgi:hypothetical protein
VLAIDGRPLENIRTARDLAELTQVCARTFPLQFASFLCVLAVLSILTCWLPLIYATDLSVSVFHNERIDRGFVLGPNGL